MGILGGLRAILLIVFVVCVDFCGLCCVCYVDWFAFVGLVLIRFEVLGLLILWFVFGDSVCWCCL